MFSIEPEKIFLTLHIYKVLCIKLTHIINLTQLKKTFFVKSLWFSSPLGSQNDLHAGTLFLYRSYTF